MSITTCAISGLPLQQPVLSQKSGHVFEKELILKQIKASGQCPITGQNLEEADLIDISVEKAAAPRPITTTTVPGLLSVMQSEWDSLLLESFKLRSDLDSTRQELSHTLHQYDAACRVICKLIKERDEARRDLAAQGEVRMMPQEFKKEEMKEYQEEYKSKDPKGKFADSLMERQDELSQRRGRKELPPQNPVPEERYAQGGKSVTTIQVGQRKGALTSVDIDFRSKQVLAAGEEGCYLYDIASKKEVQRFGSKAGIAEAVFSPNFGAGYHSMALMASRDGTATLSVLNEQSPYTVPIMLQNGPLTSCRFTTLADYVLFGGQDGAYAVHNIATSQTLQVVKDATAGKGGITSLALHPDGVCLAAGLSTGVVAVWDLRSQSEIGRFKTGGQGGINSLDFSNKGINLASATEGSNVVEIWDARHFNDSEIKSKPIKLTHLAQASCVRYDISGKVLAAAGDNGVQFFTAKRKSLGIFSKERQLTGVQISANGEYVACVSSEGALYMSHV